MPFYFYFNFLGVLKKEAPKKMLLGLCDESSTRLTSKEYTCEPCNGRTLFIFVLLVYLVTRFHIAVCKQSGRNGTSMRIPLHHTIIMVTLCKSRFKNALPCQNAFQNEVPEVAGVLSEPITCLGKISN